MIVQKLQMFFRLGLSNVWRVGIYRLGLKAKLHPILKINAKAPTGPFFQGIACETTAKQPRKAWATDATYFSFHSKDLATLPNWHANPFADGKVGNSVKPWHKLGDFDPNLGDIKTVWEASRFDWLLAMAQRATFGDHAELARMNVWLQDWVNQNKPYLGVNWKCGQEASIRVLHLAAAAQILDQDRQASKPLQDLIALHLERIAPTMGYAIGQSNNHGTSEAAALFIGGSWLGRFSHPKAKKWEKMGRKWLEERAQTLILDDGTFSQYSVVYHRMVLDTYAFAETWRKRHGRPAFSQRLVTKLAKAVSWLESLVDTATGDAPNIGANDGAQILKLSNAPFRDFRPSLQLGSLLFRDQRAVKNEGIWDQPALWLEVDVEKPVAPAPTSVTHDHGGFHVLRHENVTAIMRYARFKFRPSQADVNHIDLWVNGRNLLRDAGTFSYNATDEDTTYFPGTAAHNTVQFDGRDQMPRISRFLFGNWLRAEAVEKVHHTPRTVLAAAGYTDHEGALHHRIISLTESRLVVTDNISGFQNSAILRFRLPFGEYDVIDQCVEGNDTHIEVKSNAPIDDIRLVTGYEALHYLDKSKVTVLEISFSKPGKILTEIAF